MQRPKEKHWQAASRVVLHLKGNQGQGISFSKCDLRVYGWCDSGWTCCPLTHCLLTDWFVSLDDSRIFWKFKKQQNMSRSSVEFKYHSMAMTICELKWLMEFRLFKE